MSSMAPWLVRDNRKPIRAPLNPFDKATVVSILPKEIFEKKPTLFPGEWYIPPGTETKPTCVEIQPSSWFRDIDLEQPLLEIPTSAIIVAEAIVKDYCNGIIGCDMGNAMPGLVYLPGIVTSEQFLKDHKSTHTAMIQRQKNWYAVLLKMADGLWARSNGNSIVISDDMRLAARELNQQAKDWMKNFQAVEMVRCNSCGSLRNPSYPICSTCKSIDLTHPGAKDLKFAQ